jgi:hypothetical protein
MAITPDLKDWTWVLDRPCPECGFEAYAFPREEIGDRIRTNVERWRPVLADEHVRRRPDDATWAPLEYACHVRDVFRIYDERLALMLTRDEPGFPNWDQDATAIDDDYLGQDPARVMDELAGAGEQLARSFDGVAGDQWDRRGTRSDGAAFTVETFARYLLHDPIHHLVDVGAA